MREPPAGSPAPADLPDLRKAVQRRLGHIDGVVQGDHVGFAVDPQHRGGDVLGQVALQHRHPGLRPGPGRKRPLPT